MVKVFSRYGVDLSNGSITIPHSDAIGISSMKTFVFGFKLLNTNDATIFGKENEYKLEIADGHLIFSVYDGNDYIPNVDCGVANTGWYRVVAIVNVNIDTIEKVVYVNDINNVYVDTEQVGEVAMTNNALNIGGNVVVDLFATYNAILDGDDIKTIFDRGLVTHSIGSYFSFEEGSGDRVYDIVKGDYYGTINNGIWTMGKDMEGVYNSRGKIVLVKKMWSGVV